MESVIDRSMTLFERAASELSLTGQWQFLKVHITGGSRQNLSLTGQWHFLNELLQNCHWPVNKRKWRQFNTDYFIASPIAECGHGSEKTTMKADCTRAVRRQKKGAKKGASYRRLRRLLRRLYIVNAVLEASGRQALLLWSFWDATDLCATFGSKVMSILK